MSKQDSSYQFRKNPELKPKQKIRLITKIRQDGLILDAGFLSFYILASHDNKFGTRFVKERLINYEILNSIISIAGKIYTTPQILAEVSTNIRNKAGNEKMKDVWKGCLKFLNLIIDEKYIEKEHIIKHDFFPNFGITDMSIILLRDIKNSGKIPILLTTDGKMKGLCSNHNFCEFIEPSDLEYLMS